jgi:two-component system sensor histidine kinase YesM
MDQKTILKLLLQPLVENALYHGIKNKRGKGLIVVRGRMADGWLYFSVEDDGIGMSPQRLAQVRVYGDDSSTSAAGAQSYGLYNVDKRLELYYNRSDLLEIQSTYKEGTKVTLRIPVVDNV